MVSPTPTTPLAVFTSSLAPISFEALEAAGGGAFEVDGWAEGPDFFFLGAMAMASSKTKMVMKMTRCARFQVRASEPPTWRAKDVAGYPRPPMGPGGPLLVRRGTSRCTKSRSAHGSTRESTQEIYPGSGRREA